MGSVKTCDLYIVSFNAISKGNTDIVNNWKMTQKTH